MNPLERHDTARRRDATRAGAPLLRMAGPVVAPRPADKEGKGWVHRDWHRTVYVFTRSGDLVAGDSPAAAKPVTAARVASLHLQNNTQVVVPDRATHDHLITRIRDDAGNESVARRVTAAGTMSASGRWVILTDALARRWWYPAEIDPPALAGWCRAFGLPTGPGSYTDLFDRATRATDATKQQLSAVSRYGAIERRVLEDVGSTGAEVAVTAFRNTETLSDLWDVIERFDPLLRARRVLDGTVVPVSAAGQLDADRAVLHARMPFRVREGVVLLTSADMPAGVDCRLRSIGWDADAHAIELVVGPHDFAGRDRTKKTPDWETEMRAVLDGDAALTASPFTRQASKLRATRWTRTTRNAPALSRELPLDVILAGDDDSTTDRHVQDQDPFAGFPQM